MEITHLALHHGTAIRDYVAEFSNAGENIIHGYFGKPQWSHAETVDALAAWERGENLNGWVPSSTRFLVAEGRILGNYNLRHKLTDALMLEGGHCGYSVRPTERRKGYATLMLAHAMGRARDLQIERMLVTCRPDNIGSAKAIENNGGVMQDIIHHEEKGADIARYWIALGAT